MVRSRLAPIPRRSLSRRALAFTAFAIVAATASAYGATAGGAALATSHPSSAPAVADASNTVNAPIGFSESTPPGGTHREARAAGNPQVTYHGGPVQHASVVYAVFWAPPGYSFPANYGATISQYFTDVEHDSYTASNVYGSVVQYFETNPKRFVSYNVANRGNDVDTRAFPASGCPNYTLGDGTKTKVCLTRAQIQNEVASIIASHHLSTGLASQVFLFTPQGVGSCTTATALSSGGCYNPLQYAGYCAYHSRFGSGAQVALYANMPYNALQGCASGQSPNGNAADAVLNNVAHEHNEMITDPLGTAWYDAAGREIGDKCHLKFGKVLGSTGSGKYNQVINGHRYWLQMLWSNRAKACVQRNTFPQPNVNFTFSPASPKHGKKVAFKSTVKEAGETKWAYRWSFPDGGTATAANPTHVFKSVIFSAVVVLIVQDTKGDQTRVVRFITVQ